MDSKIDAIAKKVNMLTNDKIENVIEIEKTYSKVTKEIDDMSAELLNIKELVTAYLPESDEIFDPLICEAEINEMMNSFDEERPIHENIIWLHEFRSKINQYLCFLDQRKMVEEYVD